MNARNILTIYGKELRDMLRDRRTLISMIVIPTVVMPLLMFVMVFIAMRVERQNRAVVPTVMLIGAKDSPKVRAALEADKKMTFVPTTPDWKQQISDKKVRAAIEIPDDFDAITEQRRPAEVTIYNYQGESRSRLAVGELRRFFDEHRDAVVTARLQAAGLPPSVIKPFDVKTANVAPPEKVGGNLIGGMIPYLFILLCFTGAMYPAMDLTAGEKERGTMETILCSPVARIDLVLGKFFMVLTASLATVVMSLLSMGLTTMIGGPLLSSAAGGAAAGAGRGSPLAAMFSLDPVGMMAVVGMVLPMAVLFAAALLAISVFAKSFKEAQSYVSPLIIVILLPAMIGIMPGVELNARLALVPILNVSLVSKELVSGIWNWNYLALIFGSTCLYAAIALGLAVKMFNREDVIFRA